MHKRPLFFIILVIILTFCNSLGGQFLADDDFLIVNNDFYTSFSHLKYLFTDQYFTQTSEAIEHGFQNVMASGSVAYRPVLSLTYFLDYHFWELQPMGYRLTNMLWHMANGILVYLCLFHIFQNIPKALFGSLIFSVHPLVSETVCMIGFRADLVATCFMLLALWMYMKNKIGWSAISFFLAVFSKESAVVFPFIILLYDYFFRQENKDHFRRYTPIGVVLIFYLGVYFFVFPNQTMDKAILMGGDLWTHIKTMGYIFAYYVHSFFNPFCVRVLPPIHPPQIQGLNTVEWGCIVMTVLVMLMWLIVLIRQQRTYAFFMLFFFIALLPVSNIIPLLNPYANRFMYLPLIGLSGLLVVYIHGLERLSSTMQWTRILRLVTVATLVILTIPRNMAYSDDYMLAQYVVEDNPTHPMGYLFLASSLVRIGDLKRAETTVQQGMHYGLSDPRAYYILGINHRDDLERQKMLYHACIKKFPQYVNGYIALARAYLLEGNLKQAKFYAHVSLDVFPTMRAYHYLMQMKILEDQREDGKILLIQAKQRLRHQELYDMINELYETGQKIQLPLDIGY